MRIDYGELKRRIRLIALLESIGWKSTEGRGEQLRGPCPLPACSAKPASASKSQKRSLSVHTGKNVYQCFSCGSRGNVLNFWQSYRTIPREKSAAELAQYLETSNQACVQNQPPTPQHPSSRPAKMADS